jgi:transcriptional regulator with XRE-family HTH domain
VEGVVRRATPSEYLAAIEAARIAMGISGRELGKRTGVSRYTLIAAKQKPDWRPLEETDRRLRDVLGDALPFPESFDNSRRSAGARANLADGGASEMGRLAHQPDAERRAVEKRRQTYPHHSAEALAKISAKAIQRHRERPELRRPLGDHMLTPKARAITAINLKLAWRATPDWHPGQPRPVPSAGLPGVTSKELGAWAAKYAADLSQPGVTRRLVLEWWKPVRKERKLPAEAGRPWGRRAGKDTATDEVFHDLIDQLVSEDIEKGGLKWGRWNRIAAWISDRYDREYDALYLSKWLSDHKHTCGRESSG